MGERTSKIILCKNIKLEKGYQDVLSYTESEMLELCSYNAVAYQNNYQFIRKEKGLLNVSIPYQECLKCNYMAFQNSDYSNKWFFAFIDSVEYVSDSATNIRYTIDIFSTWYDYWTPSDCLVLREHVNDDTIGLHTYPEKLETGDYVCSGYEEIGGFDPTKRLVVIGSTWLPNNTPNLPTAEVYGGVFSGVYYMAFDQMGMANNFILALDGLGRGDSIVTAFMAPSNLCPNKTGFTGIIHSNINNDDGTTSPHDFTISGYFVQNDLSGINILSDKSITSPTSLNGYTPKNNKLFTAPYNVLLISNNNGGNAEFHYEDFINNVPIFNIHGTLCPGCSIRLYPENYKKIADSIGSYPGYSYGIMAGKFPICSYQNDSFVNWMTQQSVNHSTAMFREVLGLGLAIVSQGEAGGGDIFEAQQNYMNEVYQHSLVAPQQGGSLNGGDSCYALNDNNFSVYKMTIRSEYAKMCDDYFTKYGYQVNKIKLPNQTGRSYYNYVQIGGSENIGYSSSSNFSIPSSDMETINNIYRKGVTIWHNHNSLGDYSVDNRIV